MRLVELVVEDFRKLRGRHVVKPAPTGITIVAGDNEEGKSTLLDALKRAFFMKHNTTGEMRDAIQPMGLDGTPFVAVTFSIAARAYRLEKHFRRGGVRLEGPDGALEGDAAELALARLLAFEWPGRGPAKLEHMGLAGLFWVDQGTTFDPEQKPSPTALRRLEPALADQVAMVARGEQAPLLIAEVGRRRDQHWTGARGQPRGELLELQNEVRSLKTELDELTQAESRIEALLDRLAQTIEKRRAWLAADQLGRAQREVERTSSAMAGVRALEEETRTRTAERQASESELVRLQEKERRRRQLLNEIAVKNADRAKLEAESLEAAPALDRARRRRQAADAAEAACRDALMAAEAERDALERQAEHQRLAHDLASLERTVEAAQAAAQTAIEHGARTEAEAITAEALAELERLETGLGEARAGLRAVATRLVLRPDAPTARVSLDAAAIDPALPLELTEPAILDIDGFGQIEVTPGGEQLGALRTALRDGETHLRRELAALDVASIADVRRRLAAKERCIQEARTARRRLADIFRTSGFKDMAALDKACAKARTRLAELADVTASATDTAAIDSARAAADRKLAETRERLATLSEQRQAAATAETELDRAAGHRVFAEARVAAEAARLEEQLAIEREEVADADLATALAAARSAAQATADAAARLERELARAAPEAAAREVEQATRRLAQLEGEARALDREVDRLEAELQGAGGRGIGDRKAMVQGRLELAQRRHARLLAEAKAWRLLHDTLIEVDRARQDALVEPLVARLTPYLRQLMGDAKVGFAPDTLQLDVLHRGAAAEPFKSLSVGTREQLAVLVRLAIGDLLAEAHGESPPLILDDALVYADAVRLARMKTILEEAGSRQQIIIFTCRKEDYFGLNARYLTLDDCRTAA